MTVMALAVSHLVATAMMTGIIWFVQLVHYPLMDGVAEKGFARYEARHTAWTGVVVGPLMVVEMLTATGLALAPPAGTAIPARAGLVLVLFIWTTTALIQIPLHRTLSRGFDAVAHRRLVRSNWLRTAAWSIRVGLAARIVLA